MNKFEKHVADRTDEEKIQMIADYQQLTTEGFIGGCTLRSIAREWVEFIGGGICPITSIMKDVAMECYKYFALKYLAQSHKETLNDIT